MQKVVATMVEEASFLEELSRSRAIGHRDNSHSWDKVNYGLGIPAVVAATVAGTSAFSDFDQHNVVAGVLALLSAVLTALSTFLDPSKNARLHQQASTRYGELCGEFRRFRQIDVEQGAAPEKLKNRLDALVKQFNKVDEESPTLRGRHRRGRSELELMPTAEASQSGPVKPDAPVGAVGVRLVPRRAFSCSGPSPVAARATVLSRPRRFAVTGFPRPLSRFSAR